ncbi:SusC/RagA family TonB-linked outer membrane protein [Robertkochia solimangrovi]|uniref:SusC/RagA family TonB-linked outer membrane protein n=1 Tax=Robertkochia solimangrovi TaxID=2213046 RepID=UPI00117ED512|nr:TonB-dependent receptor [Robertkochia solimangrovi]TRZ45080.1 SusC/RagA family TonB-linked outer membrane protein [Robertkochia solimangrovi]
MMLKFKFMFIALVMVCTQQAFSQTRTISGNVTDATNMPLPGVSVMVEGTNNGTMTDFDGNYTINNVGPNDFLIFSYVGMQEKRIAVGTNATINAVLEESLESLEEVVVVGYGVQKKALTTGANVNVKGEDIARLNTATAMEALQGVTPGVSITRNSGQPGAGTKVTIRGLGTTGSSNPLYIVDGVATGNIDYLSSGDIESIDVLKDAASAAIYGSRAANGVVLVTTRKGRKGRQAQVHYETYYGFQNIYKNLTPLNAQEYMYIMDEGRVNDGLAPYDWQSRILNNSWLNNNFSGDLGTQLGEDVWAMLQNGWEGTNWIDEMTTKNAPISNHSINITGGSEDIVYSFGASYFDQTGMLGGDLTNAGFKRLTTRMNTEFVLFKNNSHSIITMGENFTYTNSENRSVATGNIYWNDLHNALIQHPLMPAYWDKSPNQFGFTPTMEGISNFQHNPLAIMFYRHNYANLGNKSNSIVGNVYLQIEPIKNLKFRSSYGVDAWFGHSRSWTPTYALGALYNNSVDGASQSQYFGNNWTFTNTLTYDFELGDHKFNAMIGNELYKNQINNEVGGSMANTRFGLPDYAFLNNVDKSDIGSINTWGADWAAGGGGLMSYIARVQYNYKEKYLLSGSIRADGSSNFAEDFRWGYFPSVSAGWVISKEDFMGDSGTFIKLRGSWGQNGNQSIPNFYYTTTLSYVNPGYFFGDTKPISGATAIPARVSNPDIGWETSEQLNFGVDMRFFDSRLTFTADWYDKSTKDWLVLAPLLGTAGAAAPYINGGDVKNTGFEVMVGWNDNSGDFKYGVTVSGAYNKNEVTKLNNAEGIIQGPSHVLSQGTAPVSRVQVGYPIGYFYGFETDGLLQNQDDVDAWVKPTDGTPYFSDQRPGDVKFVDQNQDGVIDEADKVELGSPLPDFELGIQLNAEYKGFYANATMAGKFGMQVMQSYRSFADSPTQNYTTQIFQRWHGEGTSDRIPRLSSVSNRNTNYVSDIYMHDADYLRISNLTVGYSLRNQLKNVNYISDIKVYMAVNNLYTFTGYDGMDPEVSFGHDASWASGIDLGLYPLPRTVMFGLNVDF